MTPKERLHKSLDEFRRSVGYSLETLQKQCDDDNFHHMSHAMRMLHQRLSFLDSEITVAIKQQLAIDQMKDGV